MSLRTIVHAGLADRLGLRRRVVHDLERQRPIDTAVQGNDVSMRFLEASMAFIAIATAILISAGR